MGFSQYLKKKNLMFLLAYGIYILAMSLEYTDLRYGFDKGLQLMRYAAYALFLIKIILEIRYHKKSLFLFTILLFFFIIQAGGTGMREICFLLLILFSCQKEDVRPALKLQIVIQIFCLILTFALCAAGILTNGEYFDHGKIRYSMGFVYINGAGALLFSSETAWMFIRGKKITIFETFLFLSGWRIIYYYTDLRTMTLIGCAMAVAGVVIKYCKWSVKEALPKMFYLMFPIAMTVFTWILQLYYNLYSHEKLCIVLNSILNGRLNLAKRALENYEINLLGQKIQWIGNIDNLVRNKYNYVDCSYIRMPLDYGVLISLIFLGIYCFIMYRLVKENNRAGCVALCAVLVCGFMMHILGGVHYNPLLLLAGGIFHGKTKIRQT